ncbi:unnamed protein product [Fraxinus pennsylvanica]|uniref:Diacylglycerol O-acyltransferase 3, cytosolic n=1 Tax=Fraxinus pennsylvanica TaxID=56036 RepID=A0AAD1ZN63_9LAMI|nr:unnamed protein product [Fraxinus pennsylvanica]
MEVSRFALGQSSCFSVAGMDVHAPISHYSASSSSLSIPCRGKSGFSSRRGKMCGFSDTGHLEYYNYNNKTSGIIWCGKKENIKERETKKIKNKLKLLKGLSKDLSTFSNMGFGFNSDEVKGNTITEAAELLMEQLEKLRAEEKELKKKRKEEKAKVKAERTRTQLECDMSSSSSSESSDSECGEVVDMNLLKCAQAIPNPNTLQTVDEEVASPPLSMSTLEGTTIRLQQSISESIPTVLSTITEEKIDVGRGIESFNSVQESCSRTDSLCRDASDVSLVKVDSAMKIEVCMGGKCKKSGAAALLEEFQKMVGIEVGVSGCKCMGKCRSGPNVRVQNNFEGVQAGGDDVSVRGSTNPLFIGVRLEDVDLIVANLLGDNQPNEFEFSATAAAS